MLAGLVCSVKGPQQTASGAGAVAVGPCLVMYLCYPVMHPSSLMGASDSGFRDEESE